MTDVQSFSLEMAEYPFDVKSKEGLTRSFVVREVTGAESDSYGTFCVSKTTGTGDKVRATNIDGIKTRLLSMAVMEVLGDGNRKKVEESEIRNWPSRVVDSLYDKAQEMSGLGEYAKDAKEEAKND
ncbi:MAG: hypothetical protein GY841_02710 [FCB group bacterium]|nr:hypothetical protein [FCB group bacterium]